MRISIACNSFYFFWFFPFFFPSILFSPYFCFLQFLFSPILGFPYLGGGCLAQTHIDDFQSLLLCYITLSDPPEKIQSHSSAFKCVSSSMKYTKGLSERINTIDAFASKNICWFTDVVTVFTFIMFSWSSCFIKWKYWFIQHVGFVPLSILNKFQINLSFICS